MALRSGVTTPAKRLDDRTINRLAAVTFVGLSAALAAAWVAAPDPAPQTVIVGELASMTSTEPAPEPSSILGMATAALPPIGTPPATALAGADTAPPQPIEGSPDTATATGRTVRNDGLDDQEVLELIAAALGQELDQPTPDNNRTKDTA